MSSGSSGLLSLSRKLTVQSCSFLDVCDALLLFTRLSSYTRRTLFVPECVASGAAVIFSNNGLRRERCFQVGVDQLR